MNLEELKQEKQILESRLFQILGKQKDLVSEYQDLEKQLNKTVGKIELLEQFEMTENQIVKMVSNFDPTSLPSDDLLPKAVLKNTLRPTTEEPASPPPICKIEGQHFFEG